jgi:lipoate---protein ligase
MGFGDMGIVGLETKGHSDIAVGSSKLAGTSVFRRKNLFVYQGSLLVNPQFHTIESLLSHPSREPDYRAGRSHAEFLTSTTRMGCSLSAAEIGEKCSTYFDKNALDELQSVMLG